MGFWTLIAHASGELRIELEHAVREALGDWAGRVVHASHAQAALAAFISNNKDVCRLVIFGTELPEDAATPLGPSGELRGLDAVRQLRPPQAQHPAGAGGPFFAGRVVFVADHVDSERLCEMQALAPMEFVTLGADWIAPFKRILSSVRQAADRVNIAQAEDYRPPSGLNLDMELLGQWKWYVGGGGVEDMGEFNVNPRTLKTIKALGQMASRKHADSDWETLFSIVGAQLNELFFSNFVNNASLMKSILKFGARNARVRFIVDDSTHELLLEALQDPDETDLRDSKNSYWMLKAPMYRRYDRRGEHFPLFKDRASRLGKVNCLIIAANPAECDLSESWGTPLEPLPRLKEETEEVRKILEEEGARASGCVARVEVFRAYEYPADDANPEATSEALKGVLNRGPWHLVHFVGHAVQSNGIGGLVLGGAKGVVVPAELLATLLAKASTQFLYLSSCKSADAYFVMRLVEQRLPAVLGFRWPVKDESALRCAKHYYAALFQGPSRKYLEYALLDAKRKLYEDCMGAMKPASTEADSVWASPVLVMQVDKAEDDSRYQAAGAAPSSSGAHSALH